MTDQHAPIAPSSLDRTVGCAGWIKQAEGMVETPTAETIEGDAAHWVALAMAAGLPTEMLLNQMAPNGVRIDEEMIEGGTMWVETLEGYPATPEERIAIERIHPTACWGTPDAWQHNPEIKMLRVADYKYGHKYVEVFENWQLIAYALGLIAKLGLRDFETILELVLVQPRCYHPDGPVRKWVVGGEKLRALANIAEAAAHEALSENPKTKSGPHCLFCPARHSCQTLQKTTGNFADFAGVADPMLTSSLDVGRELRLVNTALNRLEARQTGLQEQALALLKAGKVVPFFQLEESQARQDWTATPAEVLNAVGLLKLPPEAIARLSKPPALITPKQAIKLGVPADVVKLYSETPRGTLRVKPLDDVKARKIFGG